MDNNEKRVDVAKLTNWQLGAGFYRVASDADNAIRAFKGLKVLALEDELPVIEPLTDKQLSSAQDMLRELTERGDADGFTVPTACVRFKRGLILTKGKEGLPAVAVYPEGMTMYVADPSALSSKESRLIPACIVQAAFDEQSVPQENVALSEKELMFTVLLAASVLTQMEDGDDKRTGPEGGRFEGVPVVKGSDVTESYVKVQCLMIEGNIAMLDAIKGGTEMRVYGKVPIFVQPGATFSVQDLTDAERNEFAEMAEGKFEFTKGVIFNGLSAMIEQLDESDEDNQGFAFGTLKGLCTEGTTITRREAWLPKDVVEAGGWSFDAELPAPLPDGVNGLGEVLETATL